VLPLASSIDRSPAAASDPPAGPRFALDPSWGNHGTASWNLGVGPSPCTTLEHSLLDDGGDLSVSTCGGDIIVDRSTASGQSDTTYGSNGRARVEGPIAYPKAQVSGARVLVTHRAGALLIDPSGRANAWTVPPDFASDHYFYTAAIGAGGRTTLAYRSKSTDTVTLVRLTAAAEIDEAFGEHGMIVRRLQRRLSAYVDTPEPSGFIDIAPDGKLTLVEQRAGTVLTVERIDGDGKPDPTFGTGGVAEIDLGFIATAGLSWVRAPDGRVLFAATSFGPSNRRLFGVLTGDGRPDARIGSGTGLIRDGHAGASPRAFFTDDGTMVLGGASHYSAVVTRIDTNGIVTSATVAIGGEEGSMIGLDAAQRPVFVVTDPKPYNFAISEQPSPTLRVIRLTRELALDRSFGSNGQVLIDRVFPSWRPGTVLADGRVRLFVDGLTQLDAMGHDDTTYTDNNPTADLIQGTHDGLESAHFDNQERLVLIGTTGFKSTRRVYATRFTVDGRRDATFGTNGQADITAAIPLWVLQHYTGTKIVGFDGADRVYLMAGAQNTTDVTVRPDTSQLVRLTASGDLDATFTPTWLGSGGTAIVRTYDDGRTLVLWPGNDIGTPTTLTRLLADGAKDMSYGTIELSPGQSSLVAVLPGSNDQLTSCDRTKCRRLDGTGQPAREFGDSGVVTLSDLDDRLADGRVIGALINGRGDLVVQVGNSVLRLDADGKLDPTFGTGGIVELPDLGRTVDEDVSWNQFELDGDGVIFTGRIKPANGMSLRPRAEFATRITERGVIDENFGEGGTVALGVGYFTETWWLRSFGDGVLQRDDFVLRAIDSRGRVTVVTSPGGSPTIGSEHFAFFTSAQAAADGFDYPSQDMRVDVYAAVDAPIDPPTTSTAPETTTAATTTTTPATTTSTTTSTTTPPTTIPATTTSTTAPPIQPVAPGYVPVGPARLLDTRPRERTADGEQEGIGLRPAGTVTVLPVRGRVGLDKEAASVALTVTAPDSAGEGFVTVYPCDHPRPLASNLNTAAAATVANAVLTSLAADGSVCLYNSVATHLVVDVNGSAAAGSALVGVAPSRLLDTRDGDGALDGLGTASVRVRGRTGVGNSSAVVLNVTTTGASHDGFLTVYPCGSTRPSTSNLNVRAGITSANMVIVDVGADGAICVYSSVSVHVVVDLDGVVSRTVNGASPPRRLLDSRIPTSTRPAGPTVTRVHLEPATSTAGTTAAILNVTMVEPSADGYLTIYPCDRLRPLTSNVNAAQGEIVPNLVLAAFDQNRDVCIYNSTPTDLVIDLIGTIG
jgi:uncharacterized delta-60 repeat protein